MERHTERRLITALFIDVVGSTDLTVRFGPERMKRTLDETFTHLRDLIAAHDGTIEKYIGDAIFVLFGAPVAPGDDPERALRAAEGYVRWAAEREAHPDITLAVRVGVETGEAIVDLEAAGGEKQQMAVGRPVNLAARLQQTADPGQVLVGAWLPRGDGRCRRVREPRLPGPQGPRRGSRVEVRPAQRCACPRSAVLRPT